MSYWRELPQKIRSWKKFKVSFHPEIVKTRKIPSETYVKYPPSLDFKGQKVLNLGCGTSVYPTKNVVNIDAVAANGVNVVHDLSVLPLPFPDDTFDFIIANHVLEHIPNWWGLFCDLSRVLKVNGKLEIWVPPVSTDSSFTYRDHINRIGLLSFAGTYCYRQPGCNLVVGKENKELQDASRMVIIGHLRRPYMYWWLHFAPDWFLAWCSKHLNNVISEEGFIFIKGEKDVSKTV